ncbi:hypothetical protein CCL19_10520 [Pseudomonas syringae]|nr:hypothetical protein CCL19_10520 [Pseudomonas syringae]
MILSSPVISPAKWRSLMNLERPGFERHIIDLNYDESLGLEAAVRSVADQAEEAVRSGHTLIVLSDRHIATGQPAGARFTGGRRGSPPSDRTGPALRQ